MHKTQTIKEKIVERYSSLVDNSDQFTNTLKKPLKQTFRINSIKGNKDKILNDIVNYDASIKKISWCDNAFETDLTNLGSSIQHFSGQIYIQELTSMVPPLIVSDLIKEKTVLDCCAAPGSKTTQMAEIMNNEGHIIANDARHGRIKSLRGNLDRMGITNTTVTLRDFNSFPNTSADVYLVDAPCSSEGTIRKKNAVARKWKQHDYNRFSKLQKNLLKKACEMAPKGRTIIYSTCTMAPEENENVISQILDEEDIDLKKININGLKLDNGVTNWKEEDYNKEVKKCARMWPHHNDTDAFFLARMEKC